VGPRAGLDRCGKFHPHRQYFLVQVFYSSVQSMSYIRLADGQLGIQRLRSQYCYFTYSIVLARYYAPFFCLCNNICRFLHTLLQNYLCLYQCSADLRVKRVSSINMYTFFHVCMLLAVADYLPRTCRVPRSSFVTFLVQNSIP